MKKLILLTLVVMVSLSNVYAQKCKPAEIMLDEMTDVEYEMWGGTLASFSVMITGKGFKAKAFIGNDEDGKLYLNFVLVYEIMSAEDIDSYNENYTVGSQYSIKTDGGLLKLNIDKYSKDKSKPYKYTHITYDITSNITIDDVKFLAENSITRFRLVTDSGEKIESKVKKSKAKKLKKQFECFLATKQ